MHFSFDGALGFTWTVVVSSKSYYFFPVSLAICGYCFPVSNLFIQASQMQLQRCLVNKYVLEQSYFMIAGLVAGEIAQ